MLVSSQTGVEGGRGFEIAVRIDNLRGGGDWGEIQNNAHRVWSMHSRSSLFSVVFMCLISPTQKFKLEKSTLNTKEWGKSRFDEILELWIFYLIHFPWNMESLRDQYWVQSCLLFMWMTCCLSLLTANRPVMLMILNCTCPFPHLTCPMQFTI